MSMLARLHFSRFSALFAPLARGSRVSSLNRVPPVTPLLLLAAAVASPAQARDSLGMYFTWGAFRDPAVPRCYAIAKAAPSTLRRDYDPYASVGTWPKRGVRNQVHFRVSRKLAANPRMNLLIGGKRFALVGGGGDAWADDKATNAAIVAAMRSARSMTLSASGANGQRFSNTWKLAGAASAMDAAAVGCARR
jgi:hypothetical protein